MSYAKTVDLFPPCSTAVPGAPRMSGYSIKCGQCGAMDKMISQGKTFPPEVVARKFEARGWSVDARNAARHVCPACLDAKSKSKIRVKEMRVIQPATSAPALADPPRVMEREDRRIIFQKLSEVYLDEKRGYDEGWTDHRVATDLGVPRAWVSSIRDENFGPEGASEELRASLVEARKLVVDCRALIDSLSRDRALMQALSDRIAKAEAEAAPLLTAAERMSRKIDAIGKSVGIA